MCYPTTSDSVARCFDIFLGIFLASNTLIMLTPSKPPSSPPNPCKTMKKYTPLMLKKIDPIIVPAARPDMMDAPISVV